METAGNTVSEIVPSKTIELAVRELVDRGDLLVDGHTEKAWLCHFIAEDPFNSPNQYVGALNQIRTCQSGLLRDAAWDEVQRLGLPTVKTENPKNPGEMERRLKKAYDALQAQMSAKADTPSKGYRRGIEGVSKLPNVNASAHGDGNAGEQSGETGLLCSLGCDRVAGPDGRCDECVSAGRP
jgi:hypothetical protein